MDKRYQAFVSSTYEDLKNERQAVMGTLLENNFIPVGMEQFPASPMSQWDYIRKMIDLSDYYVLIVAGRYGSIDPDSNVSFTEKEYLYACEKDVPVLAFLYNDPDNIPARFCEKTDEGKKLLAKFRETVKRSGRLVKYYENPDDLKAKVAVALTNAIHDYPRPGWVRAGTVEKKTDTDDYEEKYKTVAAIQSEIAELRSAMSWKDMSGRDIPDNSTEFTPISNDASVLLAYAAGVPNGQIIVSRTLSSFSVSAGKWNFASNSSAREQARWRAAVNELDKAKYIQRVGHKDEIYAVTHKGYLLSDRITSDGGVDIQYSPDQYLDD